MRKSSVVNLLSAFFLLVGCSKHGAPTSKTEEKPTTAQTPAADNSQPAPAATAPRSASAATNKKPGANQPKGIGSGLVGPVHDFMTQQLRLFVQQKGRMPENFTEFTSARMDSVPRPPPGFRWAIDDRTLEVKLVRD